MKPILTPNIWLLILKVCNLKMRNICWNLISDLSMRWLISKTNSIRIHGRTVWIGALRGKEKMCDFCTSRADYILFRRLFADKLKLFSWANAWNHFGNFTLTQGISMPAKTFETTFIFIVDNFGMYCTFI